MLNILENSNLNETSSFSTNSAMQISPSLTTSLSSFIKGLGATKSKATIEAYGSDVGAFLRYVAGAFGVARLSQIKGRHVTDYLSSCREQGKSSATACRHYNSIGAFCKFLLRSGQIKNDFMQDVEPPKYQLKAVQVPSCEAMDRLLSAPDIDTETGLRDRAILELLYSSGLRASELCDLKLSDWHGDEVIIKNGKRGNVRTVPITEVAKYWIELYISEYRGEDEGYLFLTLLARKMRRQFLTAQVKLYADRVGIVGVTAHTIRHACATHLFEAGSDTRLIQEVLGHASIKTTQRYTHLSAVKMKEMFNKYSRRKSEVGI